MFEALEMTGIVRCSITDVPLSVQIEADTGAVAVSAAGDGNFRIITAPSCAGLTISRVGFRSEIVQLTPSARRFVDIGTIRLTPIDLLAVTVTTASGALVADATVSGVARSEETVVLGKTNEHGRVNVPLNVFSHLMAEHDAQVSDLISLRGLGAAVTLMLKCQTSPCVALVDVDTGKPIPFVPVRASYLDQPGRPRMVRPTDEAGMVFLAPGLVGLASADDRIVIAARAEAGDRDPLQTEAGIVARLACGTLERLDCEARPSVLFDIRDASSRMPLPIAQSRLDVLDDRALSWLSGSLSDARETNDGVLAIHGLGQNSAVRARLFITSPGFMPFMIEDALELEKDTEPLPVFLQKAPTRRIRVVSTGNLPRVRVRDSLTGQVLYWGGLDAERVTEAFPWPGHGLLVDHGASCPTDGLAQVASTALENREEAVVEIPPPGEIVVNAPADAVGRIVCMAENGEIVRGQWNTGALVFRPLCEVGYEVGPRASVVTAGVRAYHGLPAFDLRLRSGERQVIPWRKEWNGPVDLDGRVVCTGIAPSRVFVAPDYLPVGSVVAGGRLHDLFPVDESGKFSMPDLVSRPRRILAFVMNDNGNARLIAEADSGDEVRVACGRVRVRFDRMPGCAELEPSNHGDLKSYGGGMRLCTEADGSVVFEFVRAGEVVIRASTPEGVLWLRALSVAGETTELVAR